jgi:hypothetical protein
MRCWFYNFFLPRNKKKSKSNFWLAPLKNLKKFLKILSSNLLQRP